MFVNPETSRSRFSISFALGSLCFMICRRTCSSSSAVASGSSSSSSAVSSSIPPKRMSSRSCARVALLTTSCARALPSRDISGRMPSLNGRGAGSGRFSSSIGSGAAGSGSTAAGESSSSGSNILDKSWISAVSRILPRAASADG